MQLDQSDGPPAERASENQSKLCVRPDRDDVVFARRERVQLVGDHLRGVSYPRPISRLVVTGVQAADASMSQ